MTLPKPTIVIFDMDGTAVRHLDPRLLHLLEWMDDNAFRIKWFFAWIFKRGAKGPMLLDGETLEGRKKPKLIVRRVLHKFLSKPVEQIVEPCPGIYSVLDLLHAHNIPMALVSNGLGKGYGHDILQKFDLEHYFKVIIFREDIKKSKPNPEPLLLALERMKITQKESDVIWYIGDRHKDVTTAQNTTDHVPGIVLPIAYALNAAVAIIDKGLNPEQIIMSYYDMHDRLKKLLGSAPKPESKIDKKANGKS